MKIAKQDKIVRDEAIGIDRRVFAGQPIPPDLVAAYEAAGGETGNAQPAPSGKLIASQTVTLRDEALGIDRRIIEGDIVPPDLVEAYKAETGDESGSEEPAASSYDDQSVDDLQAEVDRRGLEVEGSGANGNVLKADLVAALEADDE